jgi:hypothetical protein
MGLLLLAATFATLPVCVWLAVVPFRTTCAVMATTLAAWQMLGEMALKPKLAGIVSAAILVSVAVDWCADLHSRRANHKR